MGESLGEKVTKSVALALQMTSARGDETLRHEVERLNRNPALAAFLRRSTAHMRERFAADNPAAAQSLLPDISPEEWRSVGQDERAIIKELTGA